MYGGTSITSATKTKPAYLAKPKLTAKSIYCTRPLSSKTPQVGEKRKMKYRKSLSTPHKYSYRRNDPVDTAYREAVGRLKLLLNENYTGSRRRDDFSGDDTDNHSLMSGRSRHSHHHHRPFTSSFLTRRYPYYPMTYSKFQKDEGITNGDTTDNPRPTKKFPEKYDDPKNPEMINFIQRQEDYMDQLEREAQFCRDELSGLLGKVKEVLAENENLHEKQKSQLIKSVFDHLETETETETDVELKKSPRKSPRISSKRLEGPSIVFESRISELEAQLTQTKIELRKCQEDNENYKKKLADGTLGDLSTIETYKMQIETLQREKLMLQDQVSKLQIELATLKERNSDTTHKIKRSLDVVEQAHYEKNQLESEIRRLKDELDRQHEKLRENIHEQSRRIADERAAVERRYSQQIEQLTSELGVQWEQTSKLQLELDKQRREDADVRRELMQKQAQIEDLKKEIQNKTASLHTDLTTGAAERSALEQQIATLNLANERAERQARQESQRLQAEIQSLRQRLDRADADLLHSRRENLRLSDQIASLEKELNMNAILAEDRSKKQDTSRTEAIPALPPPATSKDHELSTMIKDMENKHVSTVAELEGMIHSQNQLMEKLTSECHLLTQKLEDSSNRHKEEIRELQTNIDYLNLRLNQQPNNYVQSPPKDKQHAMENNGSYTYEAQKRPRNLEQSPRTTPVNTAPLSRQSSLTSPSKNATKISSSPEPPPRRESPLQRVQSPLQRSESPYKRNESPLQRRESPTQRVAQEVPKTEQIVGQKANNQQFETGSFEQEPIIEETQEQVMTGQYDQGQYDQNYQQYQDQQYPQEYQEEYQPQQEYNQEQYLDQQYSAQENYPDQQYDPNYQYEGDQQYDQQYPDQQQYSEQYQDQSYPSTEQYEYQSTDQQYQPSQNQSQEVSQNLPQQKSPEVPSQRLSKNGDTQKDTKKSPEGKK